MNQMDKNWLWNITIVRDDKKKKGKDIKFWSKSRSEVESEIRTTHKFIIRNGKWDPYFPRKSKVENTTFSLYLKDWSVLKKCFF